ncbi:MAG TPA: TetR/AcrR family transcriptional regulator [Polyangiaceae bacterium]|nr:TetR/AcrR family transcriptional regulator [Polyangiaceae bacterium]
MDAQPTQDELGTRERIVQAADDLFYRRGFERTSFADIAEAVKISRGNFYHHFKSKDDILDAVVARRLVGTRQMLAQWEAAGADPCERIRLFIDILIRNRSLILKYGCPVGTLCTELAKLEHATLPEANMIFTIFREWLRRQFESLGADEDADLFAMQLLARSQGVATLANAFDDEPFLRREVREIHAWLEARLADANPRRAISSRKRNKEM